MTEKIYYLKNSMSMMTALNYIVDTFPCFMETELIELDYSKITLFVRNQDLASIEKILAPLI